MTWNRAAGTVAKTWGTLFFDVFIAIQLLQWLVCIKTALPFFFSLFPFQTLAACESLCLIQPGQQWWFKARLSASAALSPECPAVQDCPSQAKVTMVTAVVLSLKGRLTLRSECNEKDWLFDFHSKNNSKFRETRPNKCSFSFACCKFTPLCIAELQDKQICPKKGKKNSHEFLKHKKSDCRRRRMCFKGK